MNTDQIEINLSILGIKNKSQLSERDIFFWWQRKYLEIQKLNLKNKDEKLIDLNNAREQLESIEISIIFSFLESKEKKDSHTEKYEQTEPPQEIIESKNKEFEYLPTLLNGDEDVKPKEKLKTSNFSVLDNKGINETLNYKNSKINNFVKKNISKNNKETWFLITSLTSILIFIPAFIFLVFGTQNNKNMEFTYSYNLEKKVGNSEIKTIHYSNGDKFMGDILNGKKHGRGIYTWANGSEYNGEWYDDRQQGHGSFTYTTGSKYVGEFARGMKHGLGTMMMIGGKRYSGEWEFGKYKGQLRY